MGKNIFLIGFSGSGKTSVGRLMAKKLNRKFYDSDGLIEKKSRMTISDIFEQKGENWFRMEEKKVIKQILSKKILTVTALGAGSFQNREIRSQLLKSGITVYLRCSQKELYNRIKNYKDRPLLIDYSGENLKNRIRLLISNRTDNYKKADYTISTTNRSITEIVKEIIRKTSDA